MKKVGIAACAIAAVAFGLVPAIGTASAQDQRLVDEVVARVNADVITRSQYLEVLDDTKADLARSLKPEEAQQRFNEIQPHLLDLMIDNMLLVQKGQEMGIDVEARVNETFRRMAEDQQQTITQFEQTLRQQGIDSAELRNRLRDRFVRDSVINQEVYGSIYRNLSDKEKREYYEANREKFMQPGELKLSELFISVEGRSFTTIEAKGREIAEAARNGGSFAELVKKFGDPTRASFANNGSLGSFKSAKDLAEPLAAAIENLQTGGVTDPIRMPEGVILLYVDERRDPSPRPYEEVTQDVGLAMVYERSQEAEKKYIEGLRKEAYIKVSEGYSAPASTGKAEVKAESSR